MHQKKKSNRKFIEKKMRRRKLKKKKRKRKGKGGLKETNGKMVD